MCFSRTGSMLRAVRKKALLVGCNYQGSAKYLTASWHDVQSMRETLIKHFGFEAQDTWSLVDDPRLSPQPTGAVVKEYLRRLVRDVQARDVLVFYFSGHGRQLPPVGVPDETGAHECIVLADNAVITDIDFRVLVDNLPEGSQFTIIADSCHSGGLVQHLEEQIGSGPWFHSPWLNKEHWQAGPGQCGYSGVHFQDCNVSHFAYAEGRSGNDHAGTSFEPLSVLEKHRVYRRASQQGQHTLVENEDEMWNTPGNLAAEFLKPRLRDEGINYARPASTEVHYDFDIAAFSNKCVLISACQPYEEAFEYSGGVLSTAIRTIASQRPGPNDNFHVVQAITNMLKEQGFHQHPGLYCGDKKAFAVFICY